MSIKDEFGYASRIYWFKGSNNTYYFVFAHQIYIIGSVPKSHSIKALVLIGSKHHWVNRSQSLTAFYKLLDPKTFIHNSRFYIINMLHFGSYSGTREEILFDDDHLEALPHPLNIPELKKLAY